MAPSDSFIQRPVNRRAFLGLLGGAAAATGLSSLLGGCSTQAPVSSAAQGSVANEVLPKYVPISLARPDIAGVNGSVPGYTTLPAKLVSAVPTPPGSGRTINAMTPLWGTIPPTDGNQYYDAVNAALGSKINFQITDGNVYGDKLAAVLASPKDVPDWVCVPGWNLPARFGSEIVDNVFADLTPHLAGEAVTKYPNLANIPTDAWKSCVFNGKLYGLPFPAGTISDATFYRADLLKELGADPNVSTPDELLALAKELTDPDKNRWGAEDLWTGAAIMFGAPPKWKLDSAGALVHRYESEEYRAALEWTTELFASGAVHPDAVAGKKDEAKARFQSGKTLLMSDGLGGWHEALRDNLKTNPSYSQLPFAPIAGNGDQPVLWKTNAAGIFSFIKKTDDASMITEILGLANALAAPFGSKEYDLINNGVEGVHFNRGSNGVPEPTELAAKELQPTYIFLVDPPAVEAKVQYPGYVEEICTWLADASQYLSEPPLYGLQISEPSQYASIGAGFPDLEADIVRGRKPLTALDDAVAEWKAAGGDQLRAFYTELLDKQ